MDVHAEAEDGATAIFEAAKGGCVECLIELYQRGADPFHGVSYGVILATLVLLTLPILLEYRQLPCILQLSMVTVCEILAFIFLHMERQGIWPVCIAY